MNQFSLEAIDYIEMYVFNAFQAAHFYCAVFGFDIIAHGNPETGLKDQISYFLRQGNINLLITSSANCESSIIQHIVAHDDGVKDIAFRTDNASKMFETAIKGGATPILRPTEIYDGKIRIIKSSIAAFGNTIHSFIQRENSSSHELPFYWPVAYSAKKKMYLDGIDHAAIALEKGTLERWKKFYEEVLGFYLLSSDEVMTEESGMKSAVMSSPSGSVKFVLVEGISYKKTSQIDNYVSSHGCSGVQHLAFSSRDIIRTARFFKNNGVKFLKISATYYDNISPVLKKALQHRLRSIKLLNILVDLEDQGYLLQMFTCPLQNRQTFFMEIIQRENSIGFGSNNIRELYKAVQKDQQKSLRDD